MLQNREKYMEAMEDSRDLRDLGVCEFREYLQLFVCRASRSSRLLKNRKIGVDTLIFRVCMDNYFGRSD